MNIYFVVGIGAACHVNFEVFEKEMHEYICAKEPNWSAEEVEKAFTYAKYIIESGVTVEEQQELESFCQVMYALDGYRHSTNRSFCNYTFDHTGNYCHILSTGFDGMEKAGTLFNNAQEVSAL